jgi:RNA polymerase sigma factor (sigma-70 family)
MDRPNPDLSRTIAAACTGDSAARERVAARAVTLALRTALAVSRDRAEAEDVAQEVAVEALRTLAKLRDPDAFEAWVHRMTVRRAIRVLKRRRRRWTRESDGDALLRLPDPSSLGDRADSTALEQATYRALARLPDRQRLAMVLRYVHDLTEAQIADALDCAPGTAASLLSRGRSQLSTDPDLEAFAPEPETLQ